MPGGPPPPRAAQIRTAGEYFIRRLYAHYLRDLRGCLHRHTDLFNEFLSGNAPRRRKFSTLKFNRMTNF
jgi:hypothetical protein